MIFSTGTIVAGNPNFSGDPMLFGLSQIFTITASPGFIAEADYDNLVISLTAVPELSTWVLILLGFAGLGYAGYRARKAISIAA
jgi:hypothetical protein